MNHKTTRNIASPSLGPGTAPDCPTPAIQLPNGNNANMVDQMSALLSRLAFLAQRAFALGSPGLTTKHDFTVPPADDLSQATLADVQAEARRAREKYPEHPANTHHDWLRAAAEELGECSQVIHNGGMTQEEMNRLRNEVLQLAATALNWADCADFSPTKPGQRA